MKIKVIVSGGFRNFHLSMAAEELARKGLLSKFICSAYPTGRIKAFLDFIGVANNKKIDRFINRKVDVQDTLIYSQYLSELFNYLAVSFSRNPKLRDQLKVKTVKWYSKKCFTPLRNHVGENNKIYHYRAQFGGESVAEAKALGYFALCDHSIADPRIIDYLVNNDGVIPKNTENSSINILEQMMLSDIEKADAILVNSDFVKKTMISQGYDESKVHVIYLGVDDAFLRLIPPKPLVSYDDSKPLQILFAGFFSYRKGGDTIIQALEDLSNIKWELKIAGLIESTLSKKHADFFAKNNVEVLGMLSRKSLAEVMSQSEVFLFPSRAEGSARVIFEALACGCYVITTENSGSIVQNDIHGRLIPIGNPDSISSEVNKLSQKRDELRMVGESNRELMKQKYTQDMYGNSLEVLYETLLKNSVGKEA